MNEQQSEMLTNLVTNPYTWVLFAFAMTLPYILKFLRRLYPKHWQEAMAKEEACTLIHQQKPEMKLVRRILTIGILGIVLLSYIIVFHVLSDVVNPLDTVINFVAIGAIPVVLTAVSYENKIKKEKNCNDDFVGSKYMKVIGIVLGIVFFILLLIVALKEWKVF